jgi:hypothetical protein
MRFSRRPLTQRNQGIRRRRVLNGVAVRFCRCFVDHQRSGLLDVALLGSEEMNEELEALIKLTEEAAAHDEALVRRLKAQVEHFREADRLLSLTWMWPKERVDKNKLEKEVWDYFGRKTI